MGTLGNRNKEPNPEVKKRKRDTSTHDLLIKKGASYLKRTPLSNYKYGACTTVLTEFSTYYSQESPDVIGWSFGISRLIECKASRSDFFADKKKPFRINSLNGVGNYRYYMTMPGLISVDELPDKWGLLELYGRSVRMIKEAVIFETKDLAEAERSFLVSALRRLS